LIDATYYFAIELSAYLVFMAVAGVDAVRSLFFVTSTAVVVDERWWGR